MSKDNAEIHSIEHQQQYTLPALDEAFTRRVSENQRQDTKHQCNSYLTPRHSNGKDNGRDSNDKKAVENVAA